MQAQWRPSENPSNSQPFSKRNMPSLSYSAIIWFYHTAPEIVFAGKIKRMSDALFQNLKNNVN
jgi:hypothetical protein